MDTETLMRKLIVERLWRRYKKEYPDARVNEDGLPDIELLSHGLIIANVVVETDYGITSGRAEKWRDLALSGSKLFLFVPKEAKMKTTELLFDSGLADRVSVGSYEIHISMP